MTRQRCELAPLATLLLVVMVGVASALAKPAAAYHSEDDESPTSSSSSSSSSSDFASSSASASSPSSATNDSSDDYYYYDYDYDYYTEGLPQRPLNMSQYHLPEEEEEGAPHVPRYMLELYADQTSRKPRLHLPSSTHDLVRSFIASSSESSNLKGDDNDKRQDVEGRGGGIARIHSLSFNVSLPKREKVNSATLRLYALITKDQYTYIGVERRVKILMEVFNTSGDGTSSFISICERDVYEVQNTWETFDVTTAVKHSLAQQTGSQILQIHIESVFSTAGNGGDLDVATAPRTDSEPLLLVYSSATPHQMAKRELKLMISHEYDDDDEGKSGSQRRRLADERRASRIKRSMAEEQEEESNRIYEGDTEFGDDLPTYAFSSLEGRRRPAGRKRRAKNSCKRKPMKVDFKDIGWDKWIIAPPSYEAYQCSGKCFYPLASHLSPTKHAVVQNLVHSLHPDRASRACCVPTKLGPISLLYVENGTPTYEYGYNDMVVLECGCR